jgi:hypothetical protein
VTGIFSALPQAKVLTAIGHAVKDTATIIRLGNNVGEVGRTNTFGDRQLQVEHVLFSAHTIFHRSRNILGN